LRTGMLVPWSSRAGCEVDDTDNRLLDSFALTCEIFSEYLGELWRHLRLCPRDSWRIWTRCCSSKVEQFTADYFHLLPLEFLGGRGPSSCLRCGYRMNPVLGWKFRSQSRHRLRSNRWNCRGRFYRG